MFEKHAFGPEAEQVTHLAAARKGDRSLEQIPSQHRPDAFLAAMEASMREAAELAAKEQKSRTKTGGGGANDSSSSSSSSSGGGGGGGGLIGGHKAGGKAGGVSVARAASNKSGGGGAVVLKGPGQHGGKRDKGGGDLLEVAGNPASLVVVEAVDFEAAKMSCKEASMQFGACKDEVRRPFLPAHTRRRKAGGIMRAPRRSIMHAWPFQITPIALLSF